MASKTTNKKAENSDNGIARVRQQANKITGRAGEIKRIADEVNDGASQQISSLDGAVGSANEMAASL
jgi:methyl-accepting chemotaxis protein